MKLCSPIGLFFVVAALMGCGASSGGDGSAAPSLSPLSCDNETYQTAMNLRIYQVMTEAFINGNPGIGHGTGYGPSHHRGDLKGITESLPYIKELGFNAIWLTPVFDSIPVSGQDLAADRLDATGYYASNYFAIDPNFGSLDEARKMVDKAHELGLYVFFDGVFGHFKNNAGDYPSPEGLTLSSEGAHQTDVGRQAIYPDDLAFFKEVATYWIEELRIDGWRLDQAYQVPPDAWSDIRRAVEETSAEVTYTNAEGDQVNPLGYLVAEIWRGAEEIAEQAYGPPDNPALCSAFDFPLRYALVRTLAVEESGRRNPSAGHLAAGFHNAYPEHAVPNAFVGNHDLLRFGDLLQRGDIAEPQDDDYWRRHKAAYSFLTAFSGPITLYYGEEIGEQVPDFADKVTNRCVEQGLCDDHVARTSGKVEGLPSGDEHQVFQANERQTDLRNYLTALMKMRAEQPALYKGERTPVAVPVEVASDLYLDHKAYQDDAVLYLLNVSDEDLTVTLDACALGSEREGHLRNLLTGSNVESQDGQYTLTIPAASSLFLDIINPTEAGPGCGDSLTGQGPLADCSAPTLEESGPLETNIFIRGTYSGGDNFAATPSNRQMGYKGDNLYQAVIDEPTASAYSFKFASSDWQYEFATAGSAVIQLGTEQPMTEAVGPGTESPIEIPEQGEYVFSFRVNDQLSGGTMMVSRCSE